MKQEEKYSTILVDFVSPFIPSTDDDELIFEIIKLGELVWNYCIAEKFRLYIFDELHERIIGVNEENKELQEVINEMIEYKKTEFDEYDNYILNTERGDSVNDDGSVAITVTHTYPGNMKKVHTDKLGTKKHPAVVKVQTEEKAMDVMQLCNVNGWEVIVGIEPDSDENLSDLVKLQKAERPSYAFKNEPPRNAPCPCGSGKLYKRCHGK